MEKDNNKEYIEPEVVKENSNDFKERARNFTEGKVDDEMEMRLKSMKQTILLKGLTILILPVAIFLLVLAGIIALVFLLFAKPFDYIISAIILFFIFSTLYKVIRIFIK